MISRKFLSDLLGVEIPEGLDVESLGHVGFTEHDRPKMLVFCESEKYLDSIDNESVSAVLTNSELADKVRDLGKIPVVVEDPRDAFQVVRDGWARKIYLEEPSSISSQAEVHPSAVISDYNVQIEEGAVIGPNVTILNDVNIGKGVFVGAGTVLGTAFDLKVSKQGNISRNFHDGRVVLEEGVEIHSNCTVDKGNSFHGDTILARDVKVSHQCYIGHSTQIDAATFVMANVSIAGGAKIGKSVLIDPGARICSFVNVGDRVRITTGSVVAFDVEEGERITGNFAVPHEVFMDEYRKRIK